MTIAFVDPISEIFYRKIILCNNLNDVIDVCAKNIFDFFFFFLPLKVFVAVYNLENCEMFGKLFEGNLRRKKHLIRNELLSISEKYPVGFCHCILLLKKRYIFMLLNRSNYSK